MANFMTVSLDCRTEELRRSLTEMLAAHRDLFVKQTTNAASVDLLILELDDANPARTFSLIRTTLNAKPQTEIALAAGRIDPQTMLEAFRLGIKEFFTSPINQQEVDQVLERFRERFKARVPAGETKQAQVISMVGSKGGVGATTAAVNLATSLQLVDRTKSVALLDLNFHDSDLPLFLDVSPNGGLRELSEDLSRLDETILRTVLANHQSGLQLLASGYDGIMEGVPAAGSVRHILDLMKSLFDYVVVDCGHVLNAANREALDGSSAIMVVTILNVPAIRRTKRLLEYLRGTQEDQGKISLVINRYISKDEELLSQAEDVLRQKAAWLIANNYSIASHALDTGIPFTVSSPRADVSKSYLKHAATIVERHRGTEPGIQGKQPEARKSSLLTRYLPNMPAIG